MVCQPSLQLILLLETIHITISSMNNYKTLMHVKIGGGGRYQKLTLKQINKTKNYWM